jgi:hypothetical protein
MARHSTPLVCLVLFSLSACTSTDDSPQEEANRPPTAAAATDTLELPRVDAAAAAEVARALEQAPPDMRHTLAAMALSELEAKRLPAPFVEGLAAIANAPPDMRSTLLARALRESLPIVGHLCDRPIPLMKSLAEMAAQERGPALFEGCKMERFDLVKREQVAGRDPMSLLMAHVALDHLSRAGELHAGELAAIEALAGATP